MTAPTPMPPAMAEAHAAGSAHAIWNDMAKIWITWPRVPAAEKPHTPKEGEPPHA